MLSDISSKHMISREVVLCAEIEKLVFLGVQDDLSGYHVFARNIDEHNKNADKYRRALNKNKIYK